MSSSRTREGLIEVFQDALMIAQKDLKVEFRSREILLTMGYFGILVVIIFSFSFSGGRSAPVPAMVSGILWVAVAFSGTLGLGRAFEREREDECLRGLLLTPVSRPAIYMGKTLGVLIFMFAVELIVFPAVMFFFNVRLENGTFTRLLLVLTLGTIGYSILGTLLAAMLSGLRSKDVLLAVILYPLVLPIIITGVTASTALLDPQESDATFGFCLRLLSVIDILSGLASLWLFEYFVTD